MYPLDDSRVPVHTVEAENRKMHPIDDNRVPVHTVEGENRYMRRHTANYYVHRVKDSLTTRLCKFTCAMILIVLFVVGLIAFILWLNLRPHRPRFYVAHFQLTPSLDQPNDFQNATITYNVTIRNSNRNIVVRYNSVYGAVYYKDQSLGVARIRSDPFDQGSKSSTSVSGSLAVTRQQWAELVNERSMGPVRVVFRLEITSVIRFQIYSWDTKRNKIHANCDVVVGPNGLILDSYRDKRCSEYFS